MSVFMSVSTLMSICVYVKQNAGTCTTAPQLTSSHRKEFQMTVADQRATQKLLTAALNILKGFYAKKAKAALVQVQQPAGPPPPPGFAAYNKNAAAGGVMGMIHSAVNCLLVGALRKLCGDCQGVRSTTGVNATLERQSFIKHEGNPYNYSLVKAMGCIDLHYVGYVVGNHECANKRGNQRNGKQFVTIAVRCDSVWTPALRI